MIPNMSRQPEGGPPDIINLIRTGTWDSAEKRELAIARWQLAGSGAKTAERPVPILKAMEARHTALLVVDMQHGFLDVGAACEVAAGWALVPNVNKLATALREKGGQVVFLRYLVNEPDGLLKPFAGQSSLGAHRESPLKAFRPGHSQFELFSGLDVRKSDTIMDTTRYSAVMGSGIVEFLKQKGIENVIIAGVTTDVGAGNTAEDLMQKDFHVVMVWDGCAARDRLEHELYLARIFGLYGDVMPTDEILQRLK
jgi:nicotinamidase-related amidase